MMQETLQQYRERTRGMQDCPAQQDGLRTHEDLALRIDADGHFKPFHGEAVLFALPQSLLSWLEGIQAELYAACAACLAERIPPSAFHITLCDLPGQAERTPDGIAGSQQEALLAIEEVRGQYPHSIAVRSTGLFSMARMGIVMGFEPAAEYDCALLTALHERFQRIAPRSRPLTLHVTLAFYKPGEYDAGMLLRLNEVMQRIGRKPYEWQLDLQELRCAAFESMAQYRSVFHDDPWNLSRFLHAQAAQYACALREIQGGRKQSHWMWYIFPQLRGLGHSDLACTYGIESLEEARAYLAHPVLGPRLVEITKALLALRESDPLRVMGFPDNLKLCSCMTLFARVEDADPAFQAVIDRFFGGKPDERTLALLSKSAM